MSGDNGLRSALAKKRLREVTYQIATADPTEANEQLRRARNEMTLANMGDNDEYKAKASAAVNDARAAVDACYFPLTLRALRRVDFEALVAKHPPGEGAEPKAQWNNDTFRPALIAACAVDSDLSEDEWSETLEGWSVSDYTSLWQTTLGVNSQTVNAGMGKD